MNDFNVVTLSGRLTRDAELRYTKTGKAVLSFSIANNQGTKENPKVNFINCVLWGNLAESIVSFLLKGVKVFLTGRIDVRQYESNGTKKTATEIIVNDISVESKKTDPAPVNSQKNFDQQIPVPDEELAF